LIEAGAEVVRDVPGCFLEQKGDLGVLDSFYLDSDLAL